MLSLATLQTPQVSPALIRIRSMKLSFTILKYLVDDLEIRGASVQAQSFAEVARRKRRGEKQQASDEMQEMWYKTRGRFKRSL